MTLQEMYAELARLNRVANVAVSEARKFAYDNGLIFDPSDTAASDVADTQAFESSWESSQDC